MSLSQLPCSYVSYRSISPTRSLVPLASSGSTVQVIREDSLVQCYNDLNARERLNAMDILRTVSDDYDMNQRICFAVIQVIEHCCRLDCARDLFRKHFPWANVVAMNGSYVFVRNSWSHTQVLTRWMMLFKIISIEMSSPSNCQRSSR